MLYAIYTYITLSPSLNIATINRVKIHSFLTSKKLLRTQESESASCELSNISISICVDHSRENS